MRVLLVNKFYYPRGGDCMVVINTERLLREQGHEVAVYAMQYPQNMDCATAPYFAREVQFAGGISNKVYALKRTLGMGDIASSFRKMLDDFKPDVVHLHNIHSYLSPVVARVAHEHGCQVVWTMHDYKLMCPAYTCRRGDSSCEECVTGNKTGVVKHRCMKGSLAASAVAWLEAVKWNRSTLEKYTDAFICPSQFMATMMTRAGFNPGKITVIPNFASVEASTAEREGYYCYVGRLSPEKGVDKLLEAASRLPHRLKVAGTGPLEETLRVQYASCANIEFLGQLNAHEVAQLLAHAHASVLPSQWYENNPLGVIESLMAGTPVVGTDMGGIPELIDETSGIVTPTEGLAPAIDRAMNSQWDNALIAARAQEKFSAARHYRSLMDIYTAQQ